MIRSCFIIGTLAAIVVLIGTGGEGIAQHEHHVAAKRIIYHHGLAVDVPDSLFIEQAEHGFVISAPGNGDFRRPAEVEVILGDGGYVVERSAEIRRVGTVDVSYRYDTLRCTMPRAGRPASTNRHVRTDYGARTNRRACADRGACADGGTPADTAQPACYMLTASFRCGEEIVTVRQLDRNRRLERPEFELFWKIIARISPDTRTRFIL